MSFFSPVPSSHDKAPACVVDEIDRVRARKLRKFSTEHKLGVWSSPRYWENPFAVLRRSLGKEHTHIDAVLNWYIRWWTPDKRPTIRNAAQFKTLWERGWLLSVYEEEKDANVTISPEVEAIVVSIDTLSRWPSRTREELPGVVQKSYVNYQAFRVSVTALLASLKVAESGTVDSRLAHAIMRALAGNDLTDPAHFVMDWFRKIVMYLGNHPQFVGSIRSWVISLDNPKFRMHLKNVFGENFLTIMWRLKA